MQNNCKSSSLDLCHSSSLSCPTYTLLYRTCFSSSLRSLFSTSNSSSLLVFPVMSPSVSVDVHGEISESVISIGSSLGSLCSICSLLKATSSMSVVLSLLVWGLGSLKSINMSVCSLAWP